MGPDRSGLAIRRALRPSFLVKMWRTNPLALSPRRPLEKARAAIGIDLEEQIAWPSVWQALKHWRAAVEAQHAYVFQLKMPIEEARGFSLLEQRCPAIVLNQSDAPAARIFTLFHEYAHLLLAKPGLCTPEAMIPRTKRTRSSLRSR